jgi:hypothetical protein
MGISTIDWIWEGPSAQNDSGAWSATRVAMVILDSALELPDLLRDPRIPQAGTDAHPAEGNLICQRSRVSGSKGPLVHFVTSDYSTVVPSASQPGTATGNPLDMAPIIRRDWVTTVEPIDKDADGNLITNSALQQPDPPLTEEFDDLRITVIRNEPLVSNEKLLAYHNHVNASPFAGAGSYEVRCRMTTEELWHGQMLYSRVNYEFIIRNGGWRRRLLDAGWHYRTEVDGEWVTQPFKEANGDPVRTPRLLDGCGQPLPQGAEPMFLEYTRFPRAELNDLNISASP